MSEKSQMDLREDQASKLLEQKLEQETNTLDAVTRSKLSAARYRATASVEETRSTSRPWTVGVGLASIALVAMVWLPALKTPPAEQTATPSLTSTTAVLEDLIILAAGDDVDFYQSVDFLLWLESNPGSES